MRLLDLNRYEIQRREAQNNDHNINVLFTQSFLEDTEGIEKSALLHLLLVHLWPRTASFSSPQLPGLPHNYCWAERSMKSM